MVQAWVVTQNGLFKGYESPARVKSLLLD